MVFSHSLSSTTGHEKFICSLCIDSLEMYIYEYHTSVMQVIQYHCQERIILTKAPCEKQLV